MDDTENTLMALDGILASNGAKLVARESEPTQTPNYSLEGLNIRGSISLEKIITAVRNFRDGTHRPDVDRPRMSILLNGVPGGGKTAFAHQSGP